MFAVFKKRNFEILKIVVMPTATAISLVAVMGKQRLDVPFPRQ